MQTLEAQLQELEQIADEADKIFNERAEAAEADAEFDGGEFSGPAHERETEKQVRQLCNRHGVSFDVLQGVLLDRWNSLLDSAMERYAAEVDCQVPPPMGDEDLYSEAT